ncbi:MAG TPA: hypothetical protein VKH37_02655, partial [Ferruginibacter sp.]|nr:hypothetical protein [Ferruginibacter sp.]
MKRFLFFLLLPITAFAQDIEPARHVDFASRKQTGSFIGLMSISPKGNMLLATFSDFGTRHVYELINLADGKTISSGDLRGIPDQVSWTEDERLLAMSFEKGNS